MSKKAVELLPSLGPTRLTPQDISPKQIGDLRTQVRSASRGYRQDRMNAIACCYAISCDLVRDSSAFEKLRSDTFFDDLKRPPGKDDVASWVLFYTFGAKSGRARDRAKRYAAILRRYEHAGVRRTGALQLLKTEGGIAKAYRLCAAKSENGTDKATTRPESEGTASDEESILDVECDERQLYKILVPGVLNLRVEVTPAPGVDEDWLRVKLLSFNRAS